MGQQEQIGRTEARFDKYGKQGLLCGADGLPHLIADGRPSHAGEFVLRLKKPKTIWENKRKTSAERYFQFSVSKLLL